MTDEEYAKKLERDYWNLTKGLTYAIWGGRWRFWAYRLGFGPRITNWRKK